MGLYQLSRQHLQLARSAAASPTLATLHWLPVNSRIDFKIALFVFDNKNLCLCARVSAYQLTQPSSSCVQMEPFAAFLLAESDGVFFELD